MLESMSIAIGVGTALGFLAGLGTGGGSLLILYLTLILNMEPGIAKGINLLFFIPGALIACLFRWKQGALDLKTLLPAILSGCAAAALCAWLGSRMDTALLKKLFGVLLIFTGLREVFYRPRNAR